jgi:hypothetical protein
MYHRTIEQCAAAVERIDNWISKAEHRATVEDFDVSVLMHWRLAPDMGDFFFQIKIACAYLRHAVARLTGDEVPLFSEEVASITEARDHIRGTVTFVRSLGPDRFADADRQMIMMTGMAEAIDAETYFVEIAVPSIHFHVGLAYAILRQAGLELKKRDFLGSVYPG